MDVTGKTIQNGHLNWTGTKQQLDVSKVNSGVYLIHLQLGNAPQKAKKFVNG
jgi:hypothetical protein